jgi:hypothetical protein
MKKYVFVALRAISGVAVNWLALLVGWWWLTLFIGLTIGWMLRPALVDLCPSVSVGRLGWGLPLGVLALQAPVSSTANALESVSGLPPTGGTLVIVLTLLSGCILSVVGARAGVARAQLPRRTYEP